MDVMRCVKKKRKRKGKTQEDFTVSLLSVSQLLTARFYILKRE